MFSRYRRAASQRPTTLDISGSSRTTEFNPGRPNKSRRRRRPPAHTAGTEAAVQVSLGSRPPPRWRRIPPAFGRYSRCRVARPSTAIETLSTESTLIAVSRGTGSPPGSRRTSLGRCRMVVVHGAIRVRRNLGMAASRDRTGTGRRPMSGSSPNHSSPRRGVSVTWRRPRRGMTQDRPTRQAH